MAKRRLDFRDRTTKAERIFGIIYIVGHSFVVPNLVVLIFALLARSGAPEQTDAKLNLICYVISFVLVLIFMFRFLKQSFADIFDDFGRFVTSVALAYAAYYAVSLVVNTLLSYLLPELINPNTEEAISLTRQDTGITAVLAVLLAPVVEESLFRGALFGAVRPKGRVAAYIVSTALFAVYHLWGYFIIDFQWIDLLYLLQYVPIGVVLAWCYERSGTIWAPIAMHALVNAIAVSVQRFM